MVTDATAWLMLVHIMKLRVDDAMDVEWMTESTVNVSNKERKRK